MKKIFICNNTISLAITIDHKRLFGCCLFAILKNNGKRLLVKDLSYEQARELLSKGFKKLQERDSLNA